MPPPAVGDEPPPGCDGDSRRRPPLSCFGVVQPIYIPFPTGRSNWRTDRAGALALYRYLPGFQRLIGYVGASIVCSATINVVTVTKHREFVCLVPVFHFNMVCFGLGVRNRRQ